MSIEMNVSSIFHGQNRGHRYIEVPLSRSDRLPLKSPEIANFVLVLISNYPNGPSLNHIICDTSLAAYNRIDFF